MFVVSACIQVNMETMEMYTPIQGKLRRTNHDGLFVKFSLSEKDYSVHAKIGYVQVNHNIIHIHYIAQLKYNCDA